MLSMIEDAGHEHSRKAALNSYSSPVVQMLLRVSVPHLTSRRRRATWANLVRSLVGIKRTDDSSASNANAFVELMKHKSGSHVVECVLEYCKDKSLSEELVALVADKARDLVQHPVANFVYQRYCSA